LVSSHQSSDVDVQSHSVRLDSFSAYYGKNCIVSDVNLKLPKKGVTCLVGPSGTGKSTILRWLNRRVGMVFQQPCVFPCSIYDNILMGLRTQKLSKSQARDIVEHGLKSASLWDEVSNRLEERADSLSLGQQQRLCLARALVLEPDVLLLDEPTASIDPVSSRAIEDLVISLGQKISVVMVTHNIGQAKRISDQVIFLCDGKIVEQGTRAHMFSSRCSAKTKTYITEEYCDC